MLNVWPDFVVAGILGLTHKQKYDLGILVHVLYSNPRVLYAPNDTDADLVVQKVIKTTLKDVVFGRFWHLKLYFLFIMSFDFHNSLYKNCVNKISYPILIILVQLTM